METGEREEALHDNFLCLMCRICRGMDGYKGPLIEGGDANHESHNIDGSAMLACGSVE